MLFTTLQNDTLSFSVERFQWANPSDFPAGLENVFPDVLKIDGVAASVLERLAEGTAKLALIPMDPFSLAFASAYKGW